MSAARFPEKLANLHFGEEQLRGKALKIVETDARLLLHLGVIEHAMDLADVLRQFETDNEDLKLVQVLGMRAFNAFGAASKLILSGYSQNGALILRDVLENCFLLDLFSRDSKLVERWRFANRKSRMKEFSPVKVREDLDRRDGVTGKKRAEIYELFSELAGHPTMKSVFMLRPRKEGDAVIGPFVEKGTLEAVLSEAGRLAIQVGEILVRFLPVTHGLNERAAFAKVKKEWVATFHPAAGN
jgi:hypothetical protein